MSLLTKILLIYFLVLTLVTFLVCGWDKHAAQRQLRRVPEKTLFLSAILGGSLGALVGMSLFRHKTRHWSFRIGMPVILAVQAAAALGVSYWSTFVR